MVFPGKQARFEQAVMPHFDAAYNLARWLARSPTDAEDVVQESFLRAFQSFDDHRGINTRGWIFAIVRNCCYTWLKKNRQWVELEEFPDLASDAPDPEALQLLRADEAAIEEGLRTLPVEFREVLVLREMEELSYKEISEVTGTALGTVMSRLSRARLQMAQHLSQAAKENPSQ